MFVENVNFVLNWWIFFGKSVKMNSYNKKGYLEKSGVFVMDYPQVKDELVEFNKLVFLYNAAIKEMKLRLETLRDEYKFLHQYDPVFEVRSRLKTIDSITAKLTKQSKEITVQNIEKYVDDVAGVRICCHYSTDIYRIVDILSTQKDIEVLNSKDYMTDAKTSGYRAYHMIVTIPVHLAERTVPVKVELQLRTTALHSWAMVEEVLENTYSDYLPEELRKDVKECADMLYAADKRMVRIQDEISQYKKERQ